MPPQRRLDEPWPEQPQAAWPRRCLINNIAVHPQHPWLAAACTDADAEIGAVLLFDAETPRLRSSIHLDGYVGWSEDRDLLRWHPDGQRLATNAETNGITLLRRGRLVGRAIPDETRDHGVGYAWLGDHIFSDTGSRSTTATSCSHHSAPSSSRRSNGTHVVSCAGRAPRAWA